jgi:hypothetical protein
VFFFVSAFVFRLISVLFSPRSSISGLMEIQMQQYDGANFVFVMNLFNVDVEAWDGAPPADARVHMAKQLAKKQRARLGLLSGAVDDDEMNAINNDNNNNNNKKQKQQHARPQKKFRRALENEAEESQDDGGLGPDMFFTMTPSAF